MKGRGSVVALAILVGVSLGTGLLAEQAGPAKQGAPATLAATGAPRDAATQNGLLDKYCVSCHNPRVNAGNLKLDAMNLSAVPEGAEVWERVIRKVRAGTMPPAGRPRPEVAAYNSLA